MIQRLIIRSIYKIRTYITELDRHVVEGCRDGAGANVVGVLGGPADEEGVAVGVGEERGDDGIGCPCVFDAGAGPEAESDEAREGPEGLEHGD